MENVQSQAEGWIVAESVTVTPTDAQPGQTIYISARFVNEASWLPAVGTLQIRLDGLVLFERYGAFLPDEVVLWDESYNLPMSISSGISHRVEALEQGQANIPYSDFTVTSPAPPGQRNVSFTSIPAGAAIYVSEAYRGNTPITLPLTAGTYAVRAVYAGQEVSRNIAVTTGAGTLGVEFTFTQETPFDFTKWVKDNQWYLIGGAAGIALLALAIKKPDTVRRGYDKTKEYAGKAYEKAKEVIK